MSKKHEFTIRDRPFLERAEQRTLAPYAKKSKNAHTTRIFSEEAHSYRTAFQQDRDRIIHSRAFRRLKHKQQVFLISEGDHYRTRLTHTLEVSQLARTMAIVLGLNEALVEAIALGHDLGHTPFGHVGEMVLNDILSGKDDLDGVLPKKHRGGFKHNYQSLRVVDKIEKKYQSDGLNLTSAVREGILKHTKLLRQQYSYPDFVSEGLFFDLDSSTTLEGQVVAMCDEIAQRTHDLEDGIRASLVDLEQVRELSIAQLVEEKFDLKPLLKTDKYFYRNRLIHGLINILMDDVIESSLKNIERFCQKKKRRDFFDEELVRFSDKVNLLQLELNQFIYDQIIFRCAGHDYSDINKNMLRKVFMKLVKNPAQLPDYILTRAKAATGIQPNEKIKNIIDQNDSVIRIIADHIAGMTDRFAVMEFEKLTKPDDQENSPFVIS